MHMYSIIIIIIALYIVILPLYIQEIEPHTIENFFGLTDSQRNSPNESGYILLYQSREELV